jgi:hypothetical protein
MLWAVNARERACSGLGGFPANQVRDTPVATPQLSRNASGILLGLAERRIIVLGVNVHGIANASTAQ